MPRWPKKRFAKRLGRPAPPRGRSYDPDIPVAGYYLVRLVQNGPPAALAIWHGAPLDPVTLEPLDRSPGWFGIINGTQLVDVDRYWPACARKPITQAQHDRIAELSRTQDPASAFYDPFRKIDPLTAPVPFGSPKP